MRYYLLKSLWFTALYKVCYFLSRKANLRQPLPEKGKRQNNWSRKIIKAFLFIACCFISFTAWAQNDSALPYASTPQRATWYKAATASLKEKDNESAIILLKQLVEEDAEVDSILFLAYEKLTYEYFNKNNVELNNFYAQKWYEASQEHNQLQSLVAYYVYKTHPNAVRGDYATIIKMGEAGISILRQNRAKFPAAFVKESLWKIARCLGTIYFELEEYELAKKEYLKAEEYLGESQDSLALLDICINIAACYQGASPDTAIYYALKGMPYCNSQKRGRSCNLLKNNLAYYHYLKGNYKEAKTYTDLIDAAVFSGENPYNAYIIHTRGVIAMKLGNYTLAEKDFELVLAAKEKTKHLPGKSFALGSLSELYFATNRPVKAYQTLKEKTEIDKLLEAQMIDRKIKLYEQRKQLQAKDIQISDLENEKKVAELIYEGKLKTSGYILTILGLFFSFSILTVYFLRKRNSLLAKEADYQSQIATQKQRLLDEKNFKVSFMTNLTHELRTPVTIISGYAKEVLNKPNIATSTKTMIADILSTSDNLLSTFNHLLALSKNDASPLTVHPNQFQLKGLLDKIHYSIQPVLKAKAITYTQEAHFVTDLVIITDAQKLETVLLNLLTNAIKFTPANDGIISIITTEEDQTIKITIQDNGRGIHEADIPHIFERLFQSQHHEETPAGGIGIGLAICKEYIELLEGTISVTSTLAVGTTFTITLPKTIHTALSVEPIAFPKIRSKVENEIEHSPIDKNGAIEKPLVLIVDDNLDMCKYLKTVLEVEYQLNFAYNGKNALRLLEDEAKELPDLIITDWMMSDMDGITLTQALKEVPTLANIPVIMLTARNLAKDQAVALEVGVDDYILKPFDAKVLRDSIKNLLHQAEEASNSSIYDTPPEQVKERYALLQNGTMNSINKKEYDWLIQVENFVQAHLGKFDLTTHFIAEQFSLTTVHLNRKIKQLTGLTTKKYIQEVRYWAARDMLEKREYDSVKAVCLSVGFKDTKHFARSFKKRFGEYPTEVLKE